MQDGKSCQTRLFCVIDGMLLMEVEDVLVSAAPVFRPSPLFLRLLEMSSSSTLRGTRRNGVRSGYHMVSKMAGRQ